MDIWADKSYTDFKSKDSRRMDDINEDFNKESSNIDDEEIQNIYSILDNVLWSFSILWQQLDPPTVYCLEMSHQPLKSEFWA